MSATRDAWDMACPKCCKSSSINIITDDEIEVRLTPDGTDGTLPNNDDGHSWSPGNRASCRDCGYDGTVADFEDTNP